MLKRIFFQSIILNFVFFSVAQSAESTGMPQLNPEFWISQIFWLVLTFGMLFIILSKLILPKISKNLEARKSQILENIEAADKQREESENSWTVTRKEIDDKSYDLKAVNPNKVEIVDFPEHVLPVTRIIFLFILYLYMI